MGSLDEIVEFVETQSMEIMTMIASKDSEQFKESLHKWQKILKTVDSVIAIWMKVQKAWMRLEPIFLASEDIRAQLPEDTKRFEKVDLDWKALMSEAVDDPSVVACSCADGREETLMGFASEIDLCEKALHEYLEQKKKIFPRFYFVSNQALLDILSNGNNPEKVNSYVGDCFTGMKKMQFIEGPDEPRPYKRAKGMYSKENEYVEFEGTFDITGAVENYLCDLERKMVDTLIKIMIRCKESTEEWLEKPREMWIDGYCAQLALLATQIVWTEETTRAFDDLESGSESAMKDYLQIIRGRIVKLIGRVRTDLTRETRDKVITIITIDVHSRDVIDLFCTRKIVDSGAFQWAS
jgi:dynein heavy chain